MFRNLRLLRLPNGISATTAQLAEQLAKRTFRPCGANDRFSHGWVEPSAETGLVYSQGQQRLLCFQSEDKILPGSYVRRCAQAKAEQIEEAQGYKPGRKQMREIMELVEAELLPRAFTKLSRSMVWIDNARGWFAVDGSASRADDVIELLKQSMDMLPQMAVPMTKIAPGYAMTSWLAQGEAPGSLTIDRDCELRAKTEEKAAVKYTHSNLDSDDVRGHIASGKSATRIALTHSDRVSFVLTEFLEIKRIAMADIIKEDAARQAEDAAGLFAADFAIYTGELAKVIEEVVGACGGIVNEVSDMERAAKNLNDELAKDGASATITDSSGKVLATFGKGKARP